MALFKPNTIFSKNYFKPFFSKKQSSKLKKILSWNNRNQKYLLGPIFVKIEEDDLLKPFWRSSLGKENFLRVITCQYLPLEITNLSKNVLQMVIKSK